ncbi:TonB-dependent receptor [Herbaspirillum rhizosphaerae]|uniref:TonB-dependent receptor n=1 Tax=Herbaspirillum rhizosphaerae TaxID=346179 RepID=A0ABW8Z933_9BURK
MQSRRFTHSASTASASTSRLNLKPLAFAVRLALSAALMSSIGSQAYAQVAAQTVSYDIPAGPLGEALNRYAQQSGISIAIDANKVQGKRTQGLQGTYSVDDGFRVLLRDTGFDMRKTDVGYVLVAPIQQDSRSSASTLPAVSVTAAADNTLHLNERVTSGALGTRSQLDTPFSMAVIKSEDLAERQVTKLGDVFALDASVTDNSGGYSSWASYVTVRGLALDWQNAYRIDGKPFLTYAITLPYEHFEQIELLKGSSGYMYGFGSPGGLINYVTKRPTEEPVRSIEVGYKSNNIWSEHVDLGGRFGNDKMFGYRLNATHEQGQTFNDGHITRDSVSLALDARLTRDLIWDFQAFYQNRNSENQTPSIYAGSYTLSQLPRVPSSDDQKLLGQGQHLNTNFQMVSTGLNYVINPDWKASVYYSHSTSKRSRNESSLYLSNLAGDYANDYRSDTREGHTFDQWQAMVEGKAKTGFIDHQLVFGASWQKQVNDYSVASFYQSLGSGNLYQQNPNNYYSATYLNTYHAGDITQQALFASDTLKFSDQWSLLAGARYTNFEQNSYSALGTRTAQYKKDGVITPTVALMFKPEPGTTIYTSYVESLEQGGAPTITNSNYGTTLNPLTSKQYEFGVKTDQQRWSATAALFRIERASEYTNTTTQALVQDGRSTYQGLELGAATKLGHDWQVSSNLMFLDTKYSKGLTYNGNRVAGAPDFVAAGQVTYQVPQLSGLKLSADTKYTGTTMLRAANDIKLAGYTLFNVGANYTTRIGKYDTTFRAAINNLTDKHYWEYQYENWIKPGDPRTFSLSAKVDF